MILSCANTCLTQVLRHSLGYWIVICIFVLFIAIYTDLRRFRSYHGHSVRDLLRALRNKACCNVCPIYYFVLSYIHCYSSFSTCVINSTYFLIHFCVGLVPRPLPHMHKQCVHALFPSSEKSLGTRLIATYVVATCVGTFIAHLALTLKPHIKSASRYCMVVQAL